MLVHFNFSESLHAFASCVSKTCKKNETYLEYVQLALHEKDSNKGVNMVSTISRDVGMVHSICSYMETPCKQWTN